MLIRCMDCNDRQVYHHSIKNCRTCRSDWLSIEYDYETIKNKRDHIFNGAVNKLSKYRDLLPLSSDLIDLNEGGTPLMYSDVLSKKLGFHLYVKDESKNPNTRTFKDRGAALAISGYKEMGVSKVAVFTTGNIGMAYSCYGNEADLKTYIFIPDNVEKEKISYIQQFKNAYLFENSGDYNAAKMRAVDYAKKNNIHMDRGVKSIFRRESKKTIAYEIFEQLNFKFPDWFFQAISGGIGPLGVDFGFSELLKLGYKGKLPKLGCIQIANCSPMVKAFKEKSSRYEKIDNPDTPLLTLATGNPIAYPKLYDRVVSTNGIFESVSMNETIDAYNLLRSENFDVGYTSSVAFAGIIRASEANLISEDETVIFLNSGGDNR